MATVDEFPTAHGGDIFARLTPSQRAAVEHIQGPLLILAGPGSGKTRVITHRIANLLRHGIPPCRIVALTFTNKAADEMRQRVERLVGGRGVWMGTFHAFCARLLRRYAPLVGLRENYSILDAADSKRLFKEVVAGGPVPLSHTTPEAIAAAISWAKNNLITAEEYAPRPGHAVGAIVERLYPLYQRRLLETNSVDFDDLLLHAATLLRQNPELRAELDARYEYLMVDEYQDTNLAQYAIVRGLSIDHPNLAVTGDPDQSIYGWRGANLQNILDFERDFGCVQVVRLEENFRSTPSILRAADCLIANNVRRKVKRLFTSKAEGAAVRLIVFPSERDEADGVARRIAERIQDGGRRPRDFAVCYRINALSRQIEHALRIQGVPYQVVSGLEFYQRKEIKDVLAYLHLLHNPQHDVALLRIINTPARGIGKRTLELLAEHARRYRLSLMEAARESGLIESIPKRTATRIAAFVAACDRIHSRGAQSLRSLIESVLEESGYRNALATSEAEEDQERLANIEELITAAEEFDRQHPETDSVLETFLEQSSLVADTDAWDGAQDRVTLMTLHAAKGLEFPCVFVIAAEEGLLPHERCREDADQLEEERRLLFVGMTRAEEELQLSLAQYRAFRGQRRATVPSQFLMELPREEMEHGEPAGFENFDESDGDDFAEDGSWDAEGGGGEPPWTEDDFVQEATPPFANGLPPGAGPASQLRANRGGLPQAGGNGGPGARPALRGDRSGAPHAERLAGFRVGSCVAHPEYGEGIVIAVSGPASRRSVRVLFHDDGRSRSFLLAHSPLVPLHE